MKRSVGAVSPVLLMVALTALAVNLRSPLTAIAPVIDSIKSDLNIGSATAALLTSIPVLCFGLLTPLASLLISRSGIEKSIFMTLAGLIAGIFLRASGSLTMIFGGTLLIGVSLTIGNIVSLMVIARDFSGSVYKATGIYTSFLNVGTMLTSAMTAPLALLFGWKAALDVWSVLAIIAFALWIYIAGKRKEQAQTVETKKGSAVAGGLPSLWKRPIVWMLTVIFSAHLFIYYSLTAWLPAYMIQKDGMSPTYAGIVASVFQIMALIGSFGVPALAGSGRATKGQLVLLVAVTWLITPIGFLLMPDLWLLWSVIGGVCEGGGFTIVFMLLMDSAVNLDDNRNISAVVQGLGYTLAASGPFVMGHLREITAGWTVGFVLLSAMSLLIAFCGYTVITLKSKI